MERERRALLKLGGLTVLGLAGSGLARKAGASSREAARPGATRWGMVIDARKCLHAEGCVACIAACHTLHNVPEIDDPRREVKWIWKESFTSAFPDQEADYLDDGLRDKPVLVFCNHCDNPPCVRVCPTQATWRRDDGIVMMDWHRCIGCRYCVAGCPYGSRSFNWVNPRPHLKAENPEFPTRSKGVVEKCTLCSELVEKGKTPACVAACPEKAMIFGNLSDPDSAVRQTLRARFALRRKAGLGTRPAIHYLV